MSSVKISGNMFESNSHKQLINASVPHSSQSEGLVDTQIAQQEGLLQHISLNFIIKAFSQ